MLNENNLCNYYTMDSNPGIKVTGKFIAERFGYLDDPATIAKLVQFSSPTQTNVVFHLPQIHCSSCIFLLENLHRIDGGIIKSQTNFQKKEVFVAFNPAQITLRKVVELLAFIGYEPAISLSDLKKHTPAAYNRGQLYKLGIAGFCFANIMMLSFPEYFSGGHIEEAGLRATFSWINLGLSLPVLFYSASGIFSAAWKGLRQRYLNIDAPIALAIIVTFARSYYEIISGRGPGFLDSGTGITFFLLVGRWFQNKTYESFSFDRDYTSYFPLGVTVIKNGIETNIPVTGLKKNDRIILRNEEMIPADAILIRGNGQIDYSFVSGENTPVQKKEGDLVYAGGKQIGSLLELEIVHEASQSYITQLWNNEIFSGAKNAEKSFIHPWSRYFTAVLFSIAAASVAYWWKYDTSKIFPSLTAVLIVACPCSLLLSATFTYGNMLRLFGKNKLYLKNAGVIESIAAIDTIVLDKTGTLTHNRASVVQYEGTPLTDKELVAVKQVTRQSSHPLSKMVAASLAEHDSSVLVKDLREYAGKGVEGTVHNLHIKVGSSQFINESDIPVVSYDTGTHVHVMVNEVPMGRFTVNNQYREGLPQLAERIQKQKESLYVLSGDNDAEKGTLKALFNNKIQLRFKQSPQQKLDFIKELQDQNKNVLMLGDGLNDAGALRQSNVGIAVSDNTSQFSPACDAILDGANVHLLDRFISFARSGKQIVTASFILSIAYNVVGLSFAVRGILSPLVAAILMPASSISIVLLVTALSSLSARHKHL